MSICWGQPIAGLIADGRVLPKPALANRQSATSLSVATDMVKAVSKIHIDSDGFPGLHQTHDSLHKLSLFRETMAMYG